MSKEAKRCSRREFIGIVAAGGIGAATIQEALFQKGLEYGIQRITGELTGDVHLGINANTTGFYSYDGLEQVDAIRLAISHINGGGGMVSTMNPSLLNGAGVLGKKLGCTIRDASCSLSEIRNNIQSLLETEKVVAICGGSSSRDAFEMQTAANKHQKIYMSGISTVNRIVYHRDNKMGFRHFFSTTQGGWALSQVIFEKYGDDRRVAHIVPNTRYSTSQYKSLRTSLSGKGWKHSRKNCSSNWDGFEFAQLVQQALREGADIISLPMYGKQLVTALTYLKSAGVRDLEVNGKKLEIIVPYYSESLARKAGYDLFAGIYTPLNWHASLEDTASQAFAQSFFERYGYTPTHAGHTVYVQVLSYANAVAAAGTFDSKIVEEKLRTSILSGLGGGQVSFALNGRQSIHDLYVGVVAADSPSQGVKIEKTFSGAEVVEKTAGYSALFKA